MKDFKKIYSAKELNDLELGSVVMIGGVAWQAHFSMNDKKRWSSTTNFFEGFQEEFTSKGLVKHYKKYMGKKFVILVLHEEVWG